jgi:hypothetical protein
VADIVRALADPVTTHVPGLYASAAQHKVLRALIACRTARLGGHVQQCTDCRHRRVAYNSCRNRHCPKCQAANRARWFEARSRDLLPVGYFHVVFTLPAELGPLALQNKRVVYDILFRAASETLIRIAADRKHLGASIGVLAVLHTWGQTLTHHPHLHCIVPGGGLSLDGRRWIASRKNYFVPVKVLGRVFRGKFLEYLRDAYGDGKLRLTVSLAHLQDSDGFDALVRDVRRKPWVVYSKAPMAGPEQVLGYLARYTHRVAIANSRLVSLNEGRVSFRYKDYAQADKQRLLSLDAVEFLRRFLLHVLPRGFQRIRHYGLLANCCRQRKIDRCRTLIANGADATKDPPSRADSTLAHARCPECRVGVMVTIEIFTPGCVAWLNTIATLDSS